MSSIVNGEITMCVKKVIGVRVTVVDTVSCVYATFAVEI